MTLVIITFTYKTWLTDFQKTVLRSLSTIQRDIRNLYAITSQKSEYKQTADALPVTLPVNSREDFLKLNEWLVQKENRAKLVTQRISTIVILTNNL